MNLKCNCNNTKIYTIPLCRNEKGSLFYNQSRLRCFNCGWESDIIKEFISGTPYTFSSKMKCKFRGHKNFELILTNDGIKHACKDCGFIINNIDNYNRLQKIKKIKNVYRKKIKFRKYTNTF